MSENVMRLYGCILRIFETFTGYRPAILLKDFSTGVNFKKIFEHVFKRTPPGNYFWSCSRD